MNPSLRALPIQHRPAEAPALSIPVVPLRGAVEQDLEQFKSRLLEQLLQEAPGVEFQRPLRHAANEAAALAWMTPFPLLLLPALVQEKALGVRRHAERQREVYLRCQPQS